ncbi:unnamed protein product, partial [Phaeothamnion confervicola]
KLTGSSSSRQIPSYTEHALGGATRSRLASYDSATSIGLPRVVSNRVRLESWEWPGWGSHFKMAVPQGALQEIEATQQEPPKLGEWEATAICGNDILSSVLYVSGLVTTRAGWLSPVCLLVVAGILYLYRYIYAEAISALPMNGGSYNVLINTASKAVASFAACLAIISYIATGVVSASTAVAYLQTLLPGLAPVWSTVGLLFFFACLTALGISESARLATGMFVLHVFTLAALCVLSGIYGEFLLVMRARLVGRCFSSFCTWLSSFLSSSFLATFVRVLSSSQPGLPCCCRHCLSYCGLSLPGSIVSRFVSPFACRKGRVPAFPVNVPASCCMGAFLPESRSRRRLIPAPSSGFLQNYLAAFSLTSRLLLPLPAP